VQRTVGAGGSGRAPCRRVAGPGCSPEGSPSPSCSSRRRPRDRGRPVAGLPDRTSPRSPQHIHRAPAMHEQLDQRFADLVREREETATLIENHGRRRGGGGRPRHDRHSQTRAARRLLGYGPTIPFRRSPSLFTRRQPATWWRPVLRREKRSHKNGARYGRNAARHRARAAERGRAAGGIRGDVDPEECMRRLLEPMPSDSSSRRAPRAQDTDLKSAMCRGYARERSRPRRARERQISRFARHIIEQSRGACIAFGGRSPGPVAHRVGRWLPHPDWWTCEGSPGETVGRVHRPGGERRIHSRRGAGDVHHITADPHGRICGRCCQPARQTALRHTHPAAASRVARIRSRWRNRVRPTPARGIAPEHLPRTSSASTARPARHGPRAA